MEEVEKNKTSILNNGSLFSNNISANETYSDACNHNNETSEKIACNSTVKDEDECHQNSTSCNIDKNDLNKNTHSGSVDTVISNSKVEDSALTSEDERESKSIAKRSSSLPNPNNQQELHQSSSEYDVRAAVMRARIEQKLDELVNEMNAESESSLDSEAVDDCPEQLPEVIVKVQLIQARRCRSYSLAEMKDTAIARLQQELDDAQKVLKLKDVEVSKLSKIRDEVGAEIEDLTASLFEEANKMVHEANVKQAVAEKRAKESNMKLSMLQEEVVALKTMIQAVIPYTPSYIPSSETSVNQTRAKKTLFKRNTPPKSPAVTERQNQPKPVSPSGDIQHVSPAGLPKELYEPDPILHQEFVSWRQQPNLEKNHPFLQRIYAEDITPCMSFQNKELAGKIMTAIEANTITVENICGKNPLPKKCALLETPRFCRYRVNLGDGENYYISTLSRNRIASVCDFFCYLRYIEKGLIKHSVREVYLEILKKRRAIFVARIGLVEGDSV